MAHDATLKARCEQLYVGELLSPDEVCRRTGVALATFYRWRKDNNWETLRELEMGMKEKLGKLVLKMLEEQIANERVEYQVVNGLVNSLKKLQDLGTARERLVFEGDAEVVIETMREMSQFAALLEDQEVLSELSERLKEKRRGKE